MAWKTRGKGRGLWDERGCKTFSQGSTGEQKISRNSNRNWGGEGGGDPTGSLKMLKKPVAIPSSPPGKGPRNQTSPLLRWGVGSRLNAASRGGRKDQKTSNR